MGRASGTQDSNSHSESYLEVCCTYNLLSNCSFDPIISRAPVVMRPIIGL